LRANSLDLIKVSSELYRRPVFTVVGTDFRECTEICVRVSRLMYTSHVCEAPLF